MSLITDLADAVAQELNTGGGADTFGAEFTAQRRALPEYELAEMAGLHVTVVPASMAVSDLSRSSSQVEFGVDIGVQKKVGVDLDAEVAALTSLVDAILPFLQFRQLEAAPWATCVGIEVDPVYAPEHLAQYSVFTSVINIKYRAAIR